MLAATAIAIFVIPMLSAVERLGGPSGPAAPSAGRPRRAMGAVEVKACSSSAGGTASAARRSTSSDRPSIFRHVPRAPVG